MTKQNEPAAPEGTFKNFDSPKFQKALQVTLPKDVSLNRFTQICKRMVAEKPELLQADRQSLFQAIQRAAQDGLYPDGREGILNVYKVNVGTSQNKQYVKKVEWQIMIGGIRKRLARVGFDLTASEVCENDTYEERRGDDAQIVHTLPPFGERGDFIGAYAVARNLETGMVYRDSEAIEALWAIRELSRGGWAHTYPGEFVRKVIAKRLYKSLPIIDDFISDMIARDNENYDLDDKGAPEVPEAATRAQEAARKAANGGESENPAPELIGEARSRKLRCRSSHRSRTPRQQNLLINVKRLIGWILMFFGIVAIIDWIILPLLR